MSDQTDKTQRAMTLKAAEAFAAYVAMPPKRSYRKLADALVQQGFYKNATSALRTIAKWATDYAWQDRLANAVTDLTRQRLEQAAEIDADTYLVTSEKLRARLDYTDPLQVAVVLDIRAAVKPPATKAEVSGTVRHQHEHEHSGVVKHAHHDLSGLSDDQLDALIAFQRSRLAEAGT